MLWTEYRPVIKIGPKGALGSPEIRPIHSAPSLGQSIPTYYRILTDSVHTYLIFKNILLFNEKMQQLHIGSLFIYYFLFFHHIKHYVCSKVHNNLTRSDFSGQVAIKVKNSTWMTRVLVADLLTYNS